MNDNDDERLFRLGAVRPGEPAIVGQTAMGYVVNDENGVQVHGSDGSISTLRIDGVMETQNPTMKRIVIHDVRRVEEFSTTRHLGTVSHVIKFKGGGWFGYIEDKSGSIIEATWRDVTMTRDLDGLLQLYGTNPGGPAKPAPRGS